MRSGRAFFIVLCILCAGAGELAARRQSGRQQAAGSTIGTREFKFTVQGGKQVVATTQAGSPGKSKRLVMFTPFLDRTDGNLYNAALNSLWSLYGKQGGVFQLQNVHTRAEPTMGGNALCWRVANPEADYCVFPTKDESSGRIAALTVWMR